LQILETQQNGSLKYGLKNGPSFKRMVLQLRIGPKLGRMEILKCGARCRMENPQGELDNVFTEVNDTDYSSAIEPPRVNAPTFKIDGRIYTMLKVEGKLYNSTDQDSHQHLKNFLEGATHGFIENIFLEKFYTGLDPLTLSMVNNTTGGCFMDKIYNRIATICDRIVKHNQAWHAGDQSGGLNVGTPSLTHLMKDNQERNKMMSFISTNLALLMQ
ncbi:hypothetical protein HAX54_006784, partial [Datura stramonium]|nr:hypothetical protein [Datura stramonium]